MARLAVLEEAQAAGLAVWIEGDDLVIEGPRAAAPLAHALLAVKPAVLDALREPQDALAAHLEAGHLVHQGWDAGLARQLVSALVRRLAEAVDATPEIESLDAHALLRDTDAALWRAWGQQDLPALRRAIAAYEAPAELIFERYRATRQRLEANG
jgi:hypothetical protein